MARTVVIEEQFEWEQRQGGCPVVVNNRVLFPSGASCTADQFAHRSEPPTNTIALLRVKSEYLKARLGRSERDFYALKDALAGRTIWTWPVRIYGPAFPSGTEALQHLQGLVLADRSALYALNEALEEALSECPQEQERRRRQKAAQDAEMRVAQRAREEAEVIRSINI